MINPVYQSGLNVNKTSPSSHDSDVDVSTGIEIQFNADLDSKTIYSNIFIYKDTDFVYSGSNSIGDVTKYTEVDCLLTYKDRTIILKPKQPLDIGSRYIIYIKGRGIKDIVGNIMPIDYIAFFYTEGVATAPPCVLITPKMNDVISLTPTFEWEDQKSEAYLLQISKYSTFESLLIDELLVTSEPGINILPTYACPLDLDEGLYYWKVKSIMGNWSETQQFFVKKYEKAPVSHEDVISEDVAEMLINGDEVLEILEIFPPDLSTGVAVNLNLVYIRVSGKVEEKDINPNYVHLDFAPVDQDDDTEADGMYVEQELTYTTTVVYDEAMNETFIIFTLKPLT